MANEDRISSYIDLVALRAETEAALKEIDRLREARDELTATKKELKIAVNSKEVVEASNASATSIKNLTKEQEAATKAIIENQKAVQQKLKTDQEAEKLAQERIKTEKAKTQQSKTAATDEAKAAAAKAKSDQADQKIQNQLSDERALLNKALKDQERSYANLYLTQGKNNEQTKAARAEVLQTRAVLDDLNHAIGRYGDNVGNYAGKFTGYANVLRGLRGPTKLLGEALGVGAQEADQFRIVLEHSFQGIAAYFRAKESKGAATTADTAATTANTAATEANTVATAEMAAAEETVAVAATEATVATEALTIAEGEAVVATEAAATALTGGLYAAIAAVVAVVGVAVKYFYDLFTQEKRVAEGQKAVAEAAKEVSDGLKKQISDYESLNAIRRRGLEDELSRAEKSGASQEKLFAIKKKIADFDNFNSKVILSSSEVTNASFNETIDKYDKARSRVEFFNKEILKSQKIQADNAKLGTFTSGSPYEDVDKLKKQQDVAKAELEQLTSQKEYEQSVLEKSANATRAVNEIATEEAKFNADERRKISLEYTKFEQDLIKNRNDRVLSDERSTLNQRLAAIKSNVAAQKAILQAEKNDVLNNPASTQAEILIAEKRANTESLKLDLDAKKQKYDVQLLFSNKALQATKEDNSLRLQETAKAEQEEMGNVFEGLSKRLQAELAYNKARRDDVLNSYEYDKAILKQRAATQEEYFLLDANRDAKLIQIAHDSQKEITAIYKSEGENRQHIQDQFYQFILQNNQNDLDNSEDYAKGVQALNKSLQEKKISLEKYEKDRTAIQDDYDSKRLQSTIDKEKQLIAAKYLAGESTLNDQIKLNELLSQQDDNKNKHSLDNAKKLDAQKKKLAEAEIRLAEETAGFIIDQFENSIEVQKNELAYIQRIKEENYARELQNIASSSLSEQDKAAQTVQLQAKQAADKIKYDQQQKDLDIRKAKFDKEIAILKIAENTAVGIMAALRSDPPNVPLSIVIGAIGAVEAATVLAKPIPKYAAGLENNPVGHFGMFGEAGAEVVKMPGMNPFIADSPTIGFLPRGTSITPIGADDLHRVAYNSMIKNTANAIIEKNNDKKMDELIAAVKSSEKRIGVHVSGNNNFSAWSAWVDRNTNW